MSTGLSTNQHSRELSNVGAAAEQQRSIAEIQAALTVAAARPRDEEYCLSRIEKACQRQGMAERAEFSFSRGGTDISGATIELMSEIARHWGNVQFGFRELSQQNGESTVEAFAWDLETNCKRTLVFTVPHVRYAKGKTVKLVDPRDIYETVANSAQRRVRACIEAVIPSDVVDEALRFCRQTMLQKDPVTPEKIAQLLQAFDEQFGIKREQVEVYIQRNAEAMTPAQMHSLKKIGKSLKEGMSKPEDWFKPIEAEASGEITEEEFEIRENLESATTIDKLTALRSTIADSKLSVETKAELREDISNKIAAIQESMEPESSTTTS